MRVKNKFFYGMSLAASWAWGTSLIVGMELIQTRGILPFAIWATANSLALPMFGFLAYRIKFLGRVVSSKIISVFTTIVSVFCMWIQMNAIYQQLMVLTNNRGAIYLKIGIIILLIFLAFVLNNNGVIRSVIMDNPLWAFCYLILLGIAIYALFSKQETFEIIYGNKKEDIYWSINSCVILFSGPIMCIQNWQLAKQLKKEKQMSAHYIAGGLFAVYMVFVGILAMFKFDGFMKVAMVFVVMAVALSTADGAIVGMQEIAGKKIGLVLASIASCLWPFVIPLGVMGLWTTMGNMRKYVAAICVLIAIGLSLRERRAKKNEK